MDSGMPFLRPMGPDALRRGPQKAGEPAPVPPPVSAPVGEEPPSAPAVQQAPASDWLNLPLDPLWPEELLSALIGQPQPAADNPASPLPEDPPAQTDLLWDATETDDLLAGLMPAEDDWPEEGEDAVPTESMPTPACVPTLPPLSGEKPKRSWPVALLAVPLGLAVGYAAYRLGWMKLILQGLDQAAQWVQSLLAH